MASGNIHNFSCQFQYIYHHHIDKKGDECENVSNREIAHMLLGGAPRSLFHPFVFTSVPYLAIEKILLKADQKASNMEHEGKER